MWCVVTRPTNLRVVATQLRRGRAMSFDVLFDGDVSAVSYDLLVRPETTLPVDDDPFGVPEFRANPNEGRWSPEHTSWQRDSNGDRVWGRSVMVGQRRTWTSYGGADAASGVPRTMAGVPVRVVVSELPASLNGCYQLIVVASTVYHPTLMPDYRSDVVVWPPTTRLRNRRARRALRAQRKLARRAKRARQGSLKPVVSIGGVV